MPKKERDSIFPRLKWGKGVVLLVVGIILGIGLGTTKIPRLRFKTFSFFEQKIKQLIVKKKPYKGYDVITSASIMVKNQKMEEK